MSAERFKELLKTRRDILPSADLCARIIDYAASLPIDQQEMLTYRQLANQTNGGSLDAAFMAAMAALSTNGLGAFELHGLFVDDDEAEYPIEPDELEDAISSGVLIHPYSGIPVDNFRSKVIPFFTTTKAFRD